MTDRSQSTPGESLPGFETCSVHQLKILDSEPQPAPPSAPLNAAAPVELARALLQAADALSAAVRAIAPLLATSNLTLSAGTTRPSDFAGVTQPGSVTSGRSQSDPLTVGEVVNEFLRFKARTQISDEYARTLRTTLKSFARGRYHARFATIERADVENWLAGMGNANTMRCYLGDVRCMVNWSIRRGYLVKSFLQGVELPRNTTHAPPDVYTPGETRAWLHWLQIHNPGLARVVAIRFFAGLRTAEAKRLSEENILLDRGYIEVPALKAKTRARRLIPIQPNLRAWLEDTQKYPLRSYAQDTIRDSLQFAKVTAHKNGTRASFVSYHLAMWEKAGKTALESGHEESVLFAHYRAVVSKESAGEYWAIYPATDAPEAKPRANAGWFKKDWRKNQSLVMVPHSGQESPQVGRPRISSTRAKTLLKSSPDSAPN